MQADRDILDQGPLYALFARKRAEHPIMQCGLRDALGLPRDSSIGDAAEYCTLTFDAGRKVLTTPEVFSNKAYTSQVVNHGDENILTMDEPEHKAHRDLVSMAFFADSVVAWADQKVPPIIEDLIDKVIAKGPAVDLVKEFTSLLPVQVIVGVVGVPREDWPLILGWINQQVRTADNPERAAAASAEIRGYLTALVAKRRSQPAEDLISQLVAAEINGQRLTDKAIVSFSNLLLQAGGETTIHAVGTTLIALLDNPDQLAMVKADPTLTPRAIEEALRWENPVAHLRRLTLEDVELEGVKVPKGTHIGVLLNAANRDPARWSDPDRYDLRRPPVATLTFAAGPHYCLGINLARFEAREAVNRLLRRLPNLRYTGARPVFGGVEVRGPESLEVTFDA